MNLSYFDLCRSAPALSGGGTLCMSICRRKKGKGKRKFNGYFIAYRLTLLEDLPNSKPCTIMMLYHYIITIVYCWADYSIILSNKDILVQRTKMLDVRICSHMVSCPPLRFFKRCGRHPHRTNHSYTLTLGID